MFAVGSCVCAGEGGGEDLERGEGRHQGLKGQAHRIKLT